MSDNNEWTQEDLVKSSIDDSKNGAANEKESLNNSEKIVFQALIRKEKEAGKILAVRVSYRIVIAAMSLFLIIAAYLGFYFLLSCPYLKEAIKAFLNYNLTISFSETSFDKKEAIEKLIKKDFSIPFEIFVLALIFLFKISFKSLVNFSKKSYKASE
jgi:hypothetical protein